MSQYEFAKCKNKTRKKHDQHIQDNLVYSISKNSNYCRFDETPSACLGLPKGLVDIFAVGVNNITQMLTLHPKREAVVNKIKSKPRVNVVTSNNKHKANPYVNCQSLVDDDSVDL